MGKPENSESLAFSSSLEQFRAAIEMAHDYSKKHPFYVGQVVCRDGEVDSYKILKIKGDFAEIGIPKSEEDDETLSDSKTVPLSELYDAKVYVEERERNRKPINI